MGAHAAVQFSFLSLVLCYAYTVRFPLLHPFVQHGLLHIAQTSVPGLQKRTESVPLNLICLNIKARKNTEFIVHFPSTINQCQSWQWARITWKGLQWQCIFHLMYLELYKLFKCCRTSDPMKISPGQVVHVNHTVWIKIQQNTSKWLVVKGDVFRATDKVAGLQPHLPFKYSMEHDTLKCNNHVFSKH